MIVEAIKKAVENQNLSRKEARQVFDGIMGGDATSAQIAALITALRMKGETIGEIQGAAESMRSVAAKVEAQGDVLDVVGTGGDGKSSFNVSTASAIVAAGAGCIVAKHGNRSVSSRSGAADVLEALGVNIETDAQKNSELLRKTGFAFLFAPKHHPAMRHAIGPRKEIGIRTIFNILGPITNPAGTNTYLLGAYSEELAKKLALVLAGLDTKHALVVHGSGFDEATLTGKTTVFEVKEGKTWKNKITPEQFGFARCSEEDLKVKDSGESAKIVKSILSGGEQGPKRDTVLLNAGLAIYANNRAKDMQTGIGMARESIDSGRAMEKLERLVEESRR